MAKGKILVVDDEVYIVHILDFSLGVEGYDVMTAFDGEQALAKVAQDKLLPPLLRAAQTLSERLRLGQTG